MSDSLLDTLVKLAGLGAGGICIFAIFWVGWLISKLPPDANKNQHQTLRLFMGMTIVIAIIAFASGLANAWFNAKEVAKMESQKVASEEKVAELEVTLDDVKERAQEREAELSVALQEMNAAAQEQVAQYEAEKMRNQEIVKSLATVLNEKEIASLESNASGEIKSHIRILKDSIKRLESSSGTQ